MSKHWFLTAALTAALAGSPARAQAPAAPPACGVKVVVPTTEVKKNARVCYDCKEVDYAPTRCVPTPIPSHECPHEHHERHGLFGLFGHKKDETPDCPGCHRCGKPCTAKVLIKTIITEEIKVPACKVERVGGEPCGATAPAAEKGK